MTKWSTHIAGCDFGHLTLGLYFLILRMNGLDENSSFQPGFLRVSRFPVVSQNLQGQGGWEVSECQVQLLHISLLDFICRLFLNVQSMVLHANLI